MYRMRAYICDFPNKTKKMRTLDLSNDKLLLQVPKQNLQPGNETKFSY